MTANEIAVAVIAALESLGLEYMLVGSLASNLYGTPRSTGDADFVIQAEDLDVKALSERLGERFKVDPQAQLDAITFATRWVVQCVGSEFVVDLFLIKSDERSQTEFSRRRPGVLCGRRVWVLAAEDSVAIKLKWSRFGRAKDVEDVRNILAVQGRSLDLAYLRANCQLDGTLELFERLWNEEVESPIR